jgi:hypothetical protein
MESIEEITLFIKNSSREELNIFAENIDKQMCQSVKNDRVKWKQLYEIDQVLRKEIDVRVKETPVSEWRNLLYNNI